MSKLSAHRYFYPRVLLPLISFEILSTSGSSFPGRTSASRRPTGDLPAQWPEDSQGYLAILKHFYRNVSGELRARAVLPATMHPTANLSPANDSFQAYHALQFTKGFSCPLRRVKKSSVEERKS